MNYFIFCSSRSIREHTSSASTSASTSDTPLRSIMASPDPAGNTPAVPAPVTPAAGAAPVRRSDEITIHHVHIWHHMFGEPAPMPNNIPITPRPTTTLGPFTTTISVDPRTGRLVMPLGTLDLDPRLLLQQPLGQAGQQPFVPARQSVGLQGGQQPSVPVAAPFTPAASSPRRAGEWPSFLLNKRQKRSN